MGYRLFYLLYTFGFGIQHKVNNKLFYTVMHTSTKQNKNWKILFSMCLINGEHVSDLSVELRPKQIMNHFFIFFFFFCKWTNWFFYFFVFKIWSYLGWLWTNLFGNSNNFYANHFHWIQFILSHSISPVLLLSLCHFLIFIYSFIVSFSIPSLPLSLSPTQYVDFALHLHVSESIQPTFN